MQALSKSSEVENFQILVALRDEVKEEIKKIDNLNSAENNSELSTYLSNFRYHHENLIGLKTAQESRIQALAGGTFFLLGGVLGLLALSAIQLPITLIVGFGMDPYYIQQTILPGYSELAATVKKGAYSFAAAFKSNETLNKEIVESGDKVKHYMEGYKKILDDRNEIIKSFNIIDKNVTEIKKKEGNLNFSKQFNNEILRGITSKTINWLGKDIGIRIENVKFLKYHDEIRKIFDQQRKNNAVKDNTQTTSVPRYLNVE
jgi:hypothetical protein